MSYMVNEPVDNDVKILDDITHYYVCGTRVDSDGSVKMSDKTIRFYCGNGSTWHSGAMYATRCTESQALEYLSSKQNVVTDERKDDFFIVRADVKLTRVKVNLVDV